MLHVPALICLWDQQGKSQWAWHAAVMDRQEVRDAGADAHKAGEAVYGRARHGCDTEAGEHHLQGKYVPLVLGDDE